MVALNKVFPIDYNNMKKILWKKFDERIINVLNNVFYKNENNKHIDYLKESMIKELKDIMNSNNFLYLSMNYNYCVHKYKRGSKDGHFCGAKIFINPNDDSQKYLCSRHCKNYCTKSRKYSDKTPRCDYIRINGEQCKHICKNNDKYCYIHKKICGEDNYEYIKQKNIEKIKYRRNLYLKIKKEKHKKYLDIPKFLKNSKSAKNPEIKNILFEHIIYNYLYIKEKDIEGYKKQYKNYVKNIYDIT